MTLFTLSNGPTWRRLGALVAAAAMAGGSAPARAQGLAPEIVTAGALSESQRSALQQFVGVHRDGLSKGQGEIRAARNALLEPLRNPAVSVSFRLAYAEQMRPVLRPLLSDSRDIVAANALRVLGEIATSNTSELIVSTLSDKRPAVRYAALSALERTFVAVQRTAPALAVPQAVGTLRSLGSGLRGEANPRVAEAYVLALGAAARVPTRQLPGVRAEALSQLAQAVSVKAGDANAGDEMHAMFRRAAQAARNALTAVDIGEPRLDDAVLRDAGAMGGDLIAMARRRVMAGDVGRGADGGVAARREDLALIVADAELTVFFAHAGLGGEAQDYGLAGLLQQDREEKDQQFVRDALRLIGAAGLLTGSPFNFPDDRFVK